MMKWLALLALGTLAACSTVPAAPVERPMDTPVTLDLAEVRKDLESGAEAKFGEVAFNRLRAASTSIIAKRYFGLAPPPVLQPDGSYKDPEPPIALLVRENGQWLTATPTGWRPVAAPASTALDQALADPAFWKEPAFAPPTCTDAGASRLLLRYPNRPLTVRQGACGATARTEHLVGLALNA
jgi:hypothetical protein